MRIAIIALGFIAGVGGAVAPPASAQSLLPSGTFAPGWTAPGPPRAFVEQDLFNHIDGGAELYLEFGFVRLQVQSYVQGGAELSAELYEMADPAGALGIYLMNAGRETPWAEISARNSSEDAQMIALKGRFLLKISNFEARAERRPAMIALAGQVLSAVPDAPSGDPFVPLPAAGRVPGSERLIGGPVGLQPFYTFGEGDILDIARNKYAVLADYQAGDGSRCTRMIVSYPSAEAAAAVLRNLREFHDPYMTVIPEGDPDVLRFSDYQKKYGWVRRGDSRLEIVFNAASLDGEHFGAVFSGSEAR